MYGVELWPYYIRMKRLKISSLFVNLIIGKIYRFLYVHVIFLATNYFQKCMKNYLTGLRGRDLLFLLLPDVSPTSVAGIFRGLVPVLLFGDCWNLSTYIVVYIDASGRLQTTATTLEPVL